MVRFCKSCGCELKEDSVFCDECGTRVGDDFSNTNSLFQSYNIDMMDGEFVIRQSQIHMGCLILPFIVIGLGLFVGLITFVNSFFYNPFMAFGGFFNGLTIIGLIWLLIRWIGYISNDLILTNKRVFGK